MREQLKIKNNINNKSRLLAGYCWNWIKDGKNKSDVYDITIPDTTTSIGYSAFYRCNRLADVYYPGKGLDLCSVRPGYRTAGSDHLSLPL